VKKRRRTTKKPYSRSIVGATLEVIQKKRSEKPEVRDAAREAALRYVFHLSTELCHTILLLWEICIEGWWCILGLKYIVLILVESYFASTCIHLIVRHLFLFGV